MNRDYEKKTEELLEVIAERERVRIYDVEYVKEGSDYYLRAYIDKDGGVDIDDCERVSRALSDALDKEDFIDEAYILEVSSPGLGRTLSKERHFLQSIGQEVELKTYKAILGCKEFTGILTDYQDKMLKIKCGGDITTFNIDEVAIVRLTIDF